jgi:hypothetical protein
MPGYIIMGEWTGGVLEGERCGRKYFRFGEDGRRIWLGCGALKDIAPALR